MWTWGLGISNRQNRHESRLWIPKAPVRCRDNNDNVNNKKQKGKTTLRVTKHGLEQQILKRNGKQNRRDNLRIRPKTRFSLNFFIWIKKLKKVCNLGVRWCEIEEKFGREKENGGTIAVSWDFFVFSGNKEKRKKESSRVDLPCSHSEWLNL